MKTLFLFFATCILCITSQAQGIRTIAGNGYYDYSGDGGTATAAQFYNSYAVARDDSGNMYVVDQGNNCIRKVSVAGTVTTYAGTTQVGYSGDKGQASAAELNQPSAVATDAMGNLYIADQGNNRIRMVNNITGVIITVAGRGKVGFTGDGGPADSAELSGPDGLAIDAAGNLYITDASNERIRTVVAGTINTIAGKGTQGFGGDNAAAILASFNKPAGIALDTLGNIYIADVGNNRIRKINSSGVITTVAGNGTTGYSGDGGLAVSAEVNKPTGVAADWKGNIYIADGGNNRVRMVSKSGTISTMAGNGFGSFSGDGGLATAAMVNDPTSVIVDDSGIVYFADSKNFRIRKIDTSGMINTAAGDGTGGYSGDGGIATKASVRYPSAVAVDDSGNAYVADAINNVVRKIMRNGTIVTVAGNGTGGYNGDGAAATAAGLMFPSAVSVDILGNIYIADAGNNCIREVDTTTGFISTIAGTGVAGFSGDGAAATAAMLNNPNSVAVDAAGDVYIADLNNIRIRKINALGNISTIAGNGSRGYTGDNMPATATDLSYPGGVAVDGSGNVYLSDYGQMLVRRVNPAGTIHTVAGNGYVGFSGDGGAATSAMLSSPLGITVDASGNIYMADEANNRIRKVTAAGIISTVAGDGVAGYLNDWGLATANELNKPKGVAVDKAGDVFIADYNNLRVREVSLAFPSSVDNFVAPSSQVVLFPNPNNGRFTIESSAINGKSTVEIYNMLGEKIYSKQFSTINSQLSIELGAQSSGIYMYRVISENGNVAGLGKFIKE